MTSPDDSSAAFRQNATWVFGIFVVFMVAIAVGLSVLGWWLAGWWGLVGGVVIGVLVLAGGLIAGTMMWAMTQDGA